MKDGAPHGIERLSAPPRGMSRKKAAVAAAVIGLAALALATRFAALGDRPFHHDESIHAFFSHEVYRGTPYRYNPVYHGPFQYHAIALSFFLFGPGDTSARLVDALAGIGILLLLWPLRHRIGWEGALMTALLITLSPTLTYFSRFARNDVTVAFFTLALFVGFLRYQETGRPLYLKLAVAAMALSFVSKENTFIHVFIFGSYLLLYALVRRLGWIGRSTPSPPGWWHRFWSRRGGLVLECAAIFTVLYVLFFTSFLTNSQGLRDSLVESFTYWFGQHREPRLPGPFTYYLPLLVVYEFLPFFFGLIAVVLSIRERRPFELALVYWALFSLLTYSYLQEKVPWLVVHSLLPFTLLAGSLLGRLLRWRGHRPAKAVALGFAAFLALLTIRADFALNFRNGSDPSELAVFVQTSVDVKYLIDETRRAAMQAGGVDRLSIQVQGEAAWPLAWYLRDYEAQYTSDLAGDLGDVVVTDWSRWEEFRPRLGADYVSTRLRLRSWWVPEWRNATFLQIWRYLLYRETFSPLGSYYIVLSVRKDLTGRSLSPP